MANSISCLNNYVGSVQCTDNLILIIKFSALCRELFLCLRRLNQFQSMLLRLMIFESFSVCFSNLLNDRFVSSFLAHLLTGHVENITPVLKSLFWRCCALFISLNSNGNLKTHTN